MLLRPSTDIKRLIEGKSQRLQLTDSLNDFFAINPKYYNNKCEEGRCNDKSTVTKSVRFADESDSGMVIYHDCSSSTRSLSSIPEESIDLDRTQHARRPSSELMPLDKTDHRRRDDP